MRVLPRLAMLGATVIWGTSFVIVQKALEEIPVFHLIAYRFVLAALLLLPLARGKWSPAVRRDGIVLGVILFVGFALQTAGLLWTTPSRSAFLTAISVILVPVFGLLAGRGLRWGPAVGSVLAFAGVWTLYRPTSGEIPSGGEFGKGDALTVACAVVFAVYPLILERITRRNPLGPLAVTQFAVVAVLALPSLLLDPPSARELTGQPLIAVLVVGVLATAAAFAAWLYAQRHLSAVEAGVILTLEPVIAAALSVALGVEPWTAALGFGGLLVMAAMLVTELGGSEAG
ncbi:MAG TPA: DMT family transporter [Thermoanaerobaculia bacterium]|nr:DMT family transporter [Thermoanaerobaculia bacterium]